MCDSFNFSKLTSTRAAAASKKDLDSGGPIREQCSYAGHSERGQQHETRETSGGSATPVMVLPGQPCAANTSRDVKTSLSHVSLHETIIDGMVRAL